MDSKKIRILFADDHHLVRNGIISLLESVPEFEIAGEAENGEVMADLYFRLMPDVVVSDISMPQLSGTDAAKAILEKDASAKILFLSVYDGEEYVFQVLNAGGLGLVNKSIWKSELIEAIKAVSAGQRYFGKEYTPERLDEIFSKYKAEKEVAAAEEIQLTQREREVLQLICEGFSSQEIADRLFISKKTVDTHRGNLIRKFNVSSSAQLVNMAFKKGLI